MSNPEGPNREYRERERVRERERERGGGSTVMALLVGGLVVAVAIIGFFMYGGDMDETGPTTAETTIEQDTDTAPQGTASVDPAETDSAADQDMAQTGSTDTASPDSTAQTDTPAAGGTAETAQTQPQPSPSDG